MAKLGIIAAAKYAGVSRSTLHRRAIKKKGQKKPALSFTKDVKGDRIFDTAELDRVFNGEMRAKVERSIGQVDQHATPLLQAALDAAHEQIKDLRAERDRLARELADAHNKQWELQSLLNQRQIEAPKAEPVAPVAPPPAPPTIAGVLGRFLGVIP